MKILALDLASVVGYAIGRVGDLPHSGSLRLKRRDEGADVAAFNLLVFLRERFVQDRPDLVAIEHFLNPVAQKSADAVILQLQCFGVAVAACQAQAIRYETPHVDTVRKHFCGLARAGSRQETKRMVLSRARLLGYIPAECCDDNRADACALFDYAAAHFGRAGRGGKSGCGEGAR